MKALYMELMLFFYERAYHALLKSNKYKIPVGIPGNRDPENPCEYYTPIKNPKIKRSIQNMAASMCETDGHYLCEGCIYNKKNDQ